MSEKFVSKFRFGCKPNLPDLGSERVVVSKIDTYGAVREPHLPVLSVKIRSKNGQLNDSEANHFSQKRIGDGYEI